MSHKRPRRSLRSLGYGLADTLELPKEVFFDLPRLVVIGNLQASVENHHGLLAYDENSLTLALEAGRLVITGEALSLGMIGASGITVTGRITGVRYEPPASDG